LARQCVRAGAAPPRTRRRGGVRGAGADRPAAPDRVGQRMLRGVRRRRLRGGCAAEPGAGPAGLGRAGCVAVPVAGCARRIGSGWRVVGTVVGDWWLSIGTAAAASPRQPRMTCHVRRGVVMWLWLRVLLPAFLGSNPSGPAISIVT